MQAASKARHTSILNGATLKASYANYEQDARALGLAR
jgi:hypothetical protein